MRRKNSIDLDPEGVDRAAAEWERAHTPGASLDVLAQEESRIEPGSSAHAGRRIPPTTANRMLTAARRDRAASLRDLTAAARDRSAEARDEAAHAEDRSAEVGDRAMVAAAGALDARATNAREVRGAAAAVRRVAAGERRAAAADRAAAAEDRQLAAEDRRHAGLDELTGVFRRGTGELALTHEIDRARRSGRALVIAISDVDGLKRVNDSEGHAVGDALLRDAARAMTETMRSYDVTVRWGGDEFVCALSDVSLDVAAERLRQVRRALERRRPGASISAGLAELAGGDTLETLIARADADLYRVKATHRS